MIPPAQAQLFVLTLVIYDPAEHFKDKTIRVTGKVIEEDDQIRIRVEDPKKIELAETK